MQFDCFLTCNMLQSIQEEGGAVCQSSQDEAKSLGASPLRIRLSVLAYKNIGWLDHFLTHNMLQSTQDENKKVSGPVRKTLSIV